jgi:hypothetical protein
MTPGTHPQSVSKNTISRDPQPLSYTEKGGKRIQAKARKKLINLFVLLQRSEKLTNI